MADINQVRDMLPGVHDTVYLNTGTWSGDQRLTMIELVDEDHMIRGDIDQCTWSGLAFAKKGTKAAAHYVLTLPSGASRSIRLRFTADATLTAFAEEDIEAVFEARIHDGALG